MLVVGIYTVWMGHFQPRFLLTATQVSLLLHVHDNKVLPTVLPLDRKSEGIPVMIKLAMSQEQCYGGGPLEWRIVAFSAWKCLLEPDFSCWNEKNWGKLSHFRQKLEKNWPFSVKMVIFGLLMCLENQLLLNIMKFSWRVPRKRAHRGQTTYWAQIIIFVAFWSSTLFSREFTPYHAKPPLGRVEHLNF
jgi:hypothetical protein